MISVPLNSLATLTAVRRGKQSVTLPAAPPENQMVANTSACAPSDTFTHGLLIKICVSSIVEKTFWMPKMNGLM